MSPAKHFKLVRQIAQTISDRELFSPADRILVGVSGGKDSLALLDCLFILGYKNLHSLHVRIAPDEPLPFADFCSERSEFILVESDILAKVRSARRNNACYICSREKRKLISAWAVQHGFHFLALAHHREDVIETMLLNMIFQRETSTMMPSQELFKGTLRLVRPLYDSPEQDIIRYARDHTLPVAAWQCGYEQAGKRDWIRSQIRLWQKENPRFDVRANLFTALHNVNPAFLPGQPAGKKA